MREAVTRTDGAAPEPSRVAPAPVVEGAAVAPALPGLAVQREASVGGGGVQRAGGGWVVDADVPLGVGQMEKRAFLQAVRDEVTVAADAELAGSEWTVEGCPWIRLTMAWLRLQSAAEVEATVRATVLGAADATSAAAYIPLARAHAAEHVRHWRRTGEVTGVPPEMLERLGGGSEGAVPDALPASQEAAPTIQRRASGAATAEADPRAVLSSLGPGAPLDGGVRARLEPGFGVDLGMVRTHTDAHAAALSTRLGARAFTVGQHVAFGGGEYRPGTLAGDALLAHELAHTLQQRGASADSVAAAGTGSTAPLEREADAAAYAVLARVHGPKAGLRDALRVPTAAPPPRTGGLQLQRCGPEEPETLPTDHSTPAAPEAATGADPALTGGAAAQPSTPASDTLQIGSLPMAAWQNAASDELLFLRGRAAGSDEDRIFILPARGFVLHPTAPPPAAAAGAPPSGAGPQRGPLAVLPAVGHAGMALVNTGGGTGVVVGVAGDPSGRPLSVLVPAGLQRAQLQLGITRIDDALISHAHADHVGGLATLAQRGNITGNRVWVYPGMQTITAGPLGAEIRRLATGTVSPAFPAGWQPNQLTTNVVTHASGRTTTQSTLPVGNATLRMVTDTNQLQRFITAANAGNWAEASRFADAASMLTRISSTGASAEILHVPDLRGRDIERLQIAMGDTDFRAFVRGARIIDGFHHLGAVSTAADMRGWRLLFQAVSENGTRPFTVMAQTGPEFAVNQRLIESIQMMGGRVVEVGAPNAARPDAGITVRAGGVVTQRGGREFGANPVTAQAQRRVAQMESAIRVLNVLPEYQGHPTLNRAGVVSGLQAELTRLQGLLAARLDLATADLHRPAAAASTTLPANTAALEAVQGVERSLGTDALTRLARTQTEITEIEREARIARAQGAASQRFLALVAQVDPAVARQILLEETGRPMSRNQQRQAWRRVQSRLRAQARAQQALHMQSGPASGRARGAAWFGLFMEAWNLASPFITTALQESRDQAREDFYGFFRALVWWQEKGILPQVAGRAGGQELSGPQLGASMERRLHQDLPAADRGGATLSAEGQAAPALELLYIPDLTTWDAERRDAFYGLLRAWTSAHLNTYDDYASEFNEGITPPVRQVSGQTRGFGHNDWEMRVGVVRDGHVVSIWQQSDELTRIMNATALRVIAGTERGIEQFIVASRTPEPDVTTIRDADSPPPLRRSGAATRRMRFYSSSRTMFSERNGEAVEEPAVQFPADSPPRFVELGHADAPAGYTRVVGGDYNTTMYLRSATTWSLVGSVRIPRQPGAMLYETFAPDPEQYMDAEQLAAWRASRRGDPGFFFRENRSTFYIGDVYIYTRGPNLGGQMLVRTRDIAPE